MEQTALILIIVTLLLLVVIVGMLCLLIFKMFKHNNPQQNQPSNDSVPRGEVSSKEFHPEILERMKQVEKVKPKRADIFCQNHIEEPGETMCAICDKIFCKACIKPFKSLHFCKEHLPLIMRYDWEEVVTVKTSTHDPEQGVRLYDVKKEIFQKEHLPTYVETHYKINVDQDYIETYLVIYAQKEEMEKAKTVFADFLGNLGPQILEP